MIKQFINQVLELFYPLMKRWMPFQVFSYLLVGAANTILNIALFILCFHTLTLSDNIFMQKVALELATIISFGLTVISGFWLSKNFAFREASYEKNESKKQFGKYALVSLQGQFSDYLITKGLVLFLFFHPSIAYCISTIIMLILNYFLQKYFTFRSSKILTDKYSKF
jgi:putative flippase GtrA